MLPMTPVAVALGSNVGDREAHFRQALGLLRERLTDLRVSPLYETAPMYVEDQAPFLNGALVATTELGPLPLLRFLKEVEARVGRRDRPRFGPREIDLDLIGYGDVRYRFLDGEGTVLELPHPRAAERRFVLQPLADVAPDWSLDGGTAADLLRRTNAQAKDVTLSEDAVLSLHGDGS
jgi:2-amino-4-hydroxy-6-hydroxymethyldihydropteridine diphosphokinase